MPASERRCDRPAAYRYTWPGRDESFICEEHVGKLRAVASAMGFHLQVIPIQTDTLFHPTCTQLVSSGDQASEQ